MIIYGIQAWLAIFCHYIKIHFCIVLVYNDNPNELSSAQAVDFEDMYAAVRYQ